MGHIISDNRVKANPDKVSAIQEMPVPWNQKEFRGFLGAINCYSRFIKDLSGVVKPLTKLLQKGAKFDITEEVQGAVQKYKELLCSGKVLRFLDFSRSFIVNRDVCSRSCIVSGIFRRGMSSGVHEQTVKPC